MNQAIKGIQKTLVSQRIEGTQLWLVNQVSADTQVTLVSQSSIDLKLQQANQDSTVTQSTIVKEKNMTQVIEKPYLVDEETGEVLLEDSELRLLENTTALSPATLEVDLKALEQHIDMVGDKISARLQIARRYREQAERRATVHEKAAQWMLEQIRPLLPTLAEAKLPRYKEGEKVGQYKSKTLDLASCRFAFRKAGGWSIHNEQAALEYCDKYCRDFIKLKVDNAKLLAYLKAKNEKPEFILDTTVDEFAKVEVVI